MNNTIYDVGNHGIYVNSNGASETITDIIVSGNTVYDSYHSNIDIMDILGTLNTITVKNNLIYFTSAYDSSYTSAGIYISGTSGNVISGVNVYNNIAYNIISNGISVGQYSSGTLIYNNTIYNSFPGYTNWSPCYSVNGTGATGVILKNNIGVGCYSSALYIGNITYISEVDYNLWYKSSGTIIQVASDTYTSGQWSTYKSATGYDTNSATPADPLFIDTAGANFHLSRTSTVINAGTNLSATLTSDFSGTARPQGSAFDMGAYEYIPLTVTINQKSGQTDPTNSSTINYTVIFSESVSDFTTGDVTLSGTSGATTATVTGSGTTYNVAVTGMTGSGTAIASIDADKATGATGNTNTVSTSTDNTVTYDATGPIISASTSTSTTAGSTITWTTNENASSKVDYGLTNSYESTALETDTSPRVTSHSIVLSSLSSCTTYHYRVRSIDTALNETIDSDNTFITTGCTTSNSSSAPTAPVCSDQVPGSKAPWLYGAITQDSGSILLYFTSADTPVSKYVLEFGTKSGDYPFGVQDMGVNSRGQMTFLVQSLSPSTTYYFKIRASNGCATGDWSNEISAKTRGLVSYNQFDITESELKTVNYPITTPTPTVKKGVTKKKPTDSPKQQVKSKGYDVNVKVVDTDKKPIEGATVTLHSNPQTSKTDKNGVAKFKNVEAGDHKVLIAYNNFEGQQSINLTGDVKEFNLNITVKQNPISLSPLAYGIIGIMGLIIFALVTSLIKAKNKV